MAAAFKVPDWPQTEEDVLTEEVADLAGNVIHKLPRTASALECGWAVARALQIHGYIRKQKA